MFKRRILATAVAAAMSLTTGLAVAQSTPEESLSAVIDKVNDALEAQGSHMRLFSADAMLRGRDGRHHARKAVWRKHRFERADAEFVPHDTRRYWSGPTNGKVDDITFAIDQADAVPAAGGLTAAQTTAAIRRAVQAWDNVRCSGLVLREVPVHSDNGIAAWVIRNTAAILAGQPVPPGPQPVADILHAGFASDLWSGPNPNPVLGLTQIHDDVVAVTFTFVDGDNDLDDNQKADILLQEVYYNAASPWKIDLNERRRGRDDDDDRRDSNRGRGHGHGHDSDNDAFDVQTVALHEMGHALSLEHYGTVVKGRNGRLDARPEAVMNPVYTGTLQRLQKADVAAHCIGGWKNWPRARK